MLFLRVISIVASIVGIAYNYWIPFGPIWIPIIWNLLFISINAYRIVGLILEKRAVRFNEEELELFETVFKNFTPLEFMKLMRVGGWHDAQTGYEFARQGEAVDGLFLLYNGEVSIKKAEVEIGRIKDGSMIGEISFIRGGDATATVTAVCDSRYIHWPTDELKNLLVRNPSMDIGMQQVFSMDLTKKLIDG